MKKTKKQEASDTEERYRSSHLVIRVTTFGTDPQHQKTIQSIISELDLRGYTTSVDAIRPVKP